MNYFNKIILTFIYKKYTTSKLMLWVIIATIPGITCQIYFFGCEIIYQILLAMITAFISEASILYLRKLPIILHLKDNSALVTALLLAIIIPPLSPWWLIVLGTLFAILVAKHTYGGLGQNPFNPAMVGYIILLLSFPIQMTNWSSPLLNHNYTYSTTYLAGLQNIFIGSNTMTGATSIPLTINFEYIKKIIPIYSFKYDLLIQQINKILQQNILHNLFSDIAWQWINIAYFFGGMILICFRIISWQIPMGFLSTLLLCSLLNWLFIPSQYISPMFYLLSGSTMLSAFFIATDPVTAATTPLGRFIYGVIIGSLIWIIRVYSGYFNSFAFAILLANITVPIIDHYTRPNYLNF